MYLPEKKHHLLSFSEIRQKALAEVGVGTMYNYIENLN